MESDTKLIMNLQMKNLELITENEQQKEIIRQLKALVKSIKK